MGRAPVALALTLILARCGPSKAVPQGRLSVDDLERILQREIANTVLSTNQRGDSVERYALDEREVSLYTSFATYLVITAKQQGCKKGSPHCVRCSNGRAYCTNAAQFLTPAEPTP